MFSEYFERGRKDMQAKLASAKKVKETHEQNLGAKIDLTGGGQSQRITSLVRRASSSRLDLLNRAALRKLGAHSLVRAWRPKEETSFPLQTWK